MRASFSRAAWALAWTWRLARIQGLLCPRISTDWTVHPPRIRSVTSISFLKLGFDLLATPQQDASAACGR